jgi:hypothetical protein
MKGCELVSDSTEYLYSRTVQKSYSLSANHLLAVEGLGKSGE